MTEMDRRFSNESTTIMKAVLPKSDDFFKWDIISEFCAIYSIDNRELIVAKTYLENDEIDKQSLKSVLDFYV